MPSVENDTTIPLSAVWSEMSETEKQEFRYEFERIMREEQCGMKLMPLADDRTKMQAAIGDLTAKLNQAYTLMREAVANCPMCHGTTRPDNAHQADCYCLPMRKALGIECICRKGYWNNVNCPVHGENGTCRHERYEGNGG